MFITALTVCAENKDVTQDKLFKGVDVQAHDYSCGSAALSTLIKGIVENSHASEEDIINAIGKDKEEGYSPPELLNAAKKLGHEADWQYVKPSDLAGLKQPVILLIGLASSFPHYVVLKGIENGNVFFADPIRGNILSSYDELIKEGINNEYREWFVMAVEASKNRPKDSTLYLSDDKYDTHFTAEQSAIITLSTIAKANQLMVNYDFFTELGSAHNDNLTRQTRNFTHRLGVRYGIAANTEIGGNIAYSDNREQLNNDANDSIVSNSSNRRYEIYANHQFSLDDKGKTGMILGAGGTFGEHASIWGGNINLTAYINTAFAQFLAGGSINQ